MLLMDTAFSTREEFHAEDYGGTGDVSEATQLDASMNEHRGEFHDRNSGSV